MVAGCQCPGGLSEDTLQFLADRLVEVDLLAIASDVGCRSLDTHAALEKPGLGTLLKIGQGSWAKRNLPDRQIRKEAPTVSFEIATVSFEIVKVGGFCSWAGGW